MDPVIGNWYRHLDKGQMIQVVALDESKCTVELQHFDGDLEEIELSDWHTMNLELAEAPEDWTGPVDDVEVDDLSYTETGMTVADWRQPLEENPRTAGESWESSRPEDESDDWAEGASTQDVEPREAVETTVSETPWAEKPPERGEPESGS